MNQSMWKAATDNPPRYPSLEENIDVDVAIVGGGITGMTAAYRLMNEGKSVVVLESDTIGNGTTGHSTGNLYVPVQPYYYTIAQKFNLKTAKQVAQSRAASIDFIEQVVQTEKLSCHFHRRPWYFYTNEPSEFAKYDKEVETYKRLGLDVIDLTQLPLPYKFKKAIELRNQARINPYQYVIGVARVVAKGGVKIYEHSRVISFSEKKNGCTLKTTNGIVHAKHVLLATHTPIGINITQAYTAPYRSYVIACKLTDNSYPEGHYWDLAHPHHVMSTHPFRSEKPELLLFSGSHHKTGQSKDAQEHFKYLYDFAREDLQIETIEFKWSAQHYQSADHVPYIGLQGRTAKNIYMATGYFADGLTYGTIAGIIFAEQVLNKKTSWANTYNSLRFKPIASAGFVAAENTNVLAQYFKDIPLPKAAFSDLEKGQAKIVEVNRQKYAAYRDEHSKLHVVSAVCTHMKCIIGWNNAEKTWDCPCHGSRFDLDGKVIEGPALTNLRKKTLEEN